MSEANRAGRTPATKVTINQDFCTRTCGVSPCTASAPQKCFNTFATCQDVDNYDLGVQPLKFVDATQGHPKDDYYIPSVRSVSIGAAELNPGGTDKTRSPIGMRGTLTVQFMDHPHDDKIVDPYRTERDYDPMERGTFWTKWRARNRYYLNREIQVEQGYLVGDELVEGITQTYLITDFSGPSAAGVVTIKAMDVLTRIENDKAKAPKVSTGYLLADINSTDTAATLAPSGVGDLEYPASGSLRINKECVDFTRSGDALTFTNRAALGTEAKDHAQGDAVQIVLKYESQKPQDILFDLLTTYAGIPAAYLDKAQWDTEQAAHLPRLYSANLAEPEGVGDLVAEICEQMYMTVWFDERQGLVKMRALRNAEGDEVIDLTDSANIIENTTSWKDSPDEIITQTWVHYGQINPTEKLDQASNYGAVEVIVNLDAESREQNDMQKVKAVYSRWIAHTNAIAAVSLGRALVSRFAVAPRKVTFSLDAKDRDLWLGDFVQVTNRLNTDEFGVPRPVALQVIRAAEAVRGTRYTYTAKEYITSSASLGTGSGGSTGGGSDPVGETWIESPITASMFNVNLRDLWDAGSSTLNGDENIVFIIRAGVVIGGDASDTSTNRLPAQRVATNDFYDAGTCSNSGAALGQTNFLQRHDIATPRTFNQGADYDGLTCSQIVEERPASVAISTGSWPVGVTLRVVIEAGAVVIGEGGNGSSHAFDEAPVYPTQLEGAPGDSTLNYTVPGGDGGHAFEVTHPIQIENNGTITGGAGGGTCAAQLIGAGHVYVSGAAGAGYKRGLVSSVKQHVFVYPSTIATTGQGEVFENGESQGGLGGQTKSFHGLHTDSKFSSGAGGNITIHGPGQGGSMTEQVIQRSDEQVYSTHSYSAPGQPGAAVKAGNNDITWIKQGDIRGAING